MQKKSKKKDTFKQNSIDSIQKDGSNLYLKNIKKKKYIFIFSK